MGEASVSTLKAPGDLTAVASAPSPELPVNAAVYLPAPASAIEGNHGRTQLG